MRKQSIRSFKKNVLTIVDFSVMSALCLMMAPEFKTAHQLPQVVFAQNKPISRQ
jgi:hypothetical protein